MLPAILGLSGVALTSDEHAFLREVEPAGIILFGRNVADGSQLRALTDDLRDVTGRGDLLILVDQEGGRVSRLPPPEWPAFPAQGAFANLYRRAPISGMEAARVNAQAIAVVLAEAGINVDCLPLLDLLHEGADTIVGDRALGEDPLQVASLGRVVLDGLAAGGVAGVIKHMPGHGRAGADSHKQLPVIAASAEELERDLLPFQRLAGRARIGMTSHVLYPAWDAERCATLSPAIVADVIRDRIGFDGLLLTDDVGMGALSGPVEARAADALAAGCDLVLHCSGDLAEAKRLANALPHITQAARARLERAVPEPASSAALLPDLLAKRDALLAYA